MNTELELFKLIVIPDGKDSDFSYAKEYGWVGNNFIVCVDNSDWFEFVDELSKILGDQIFEGDYFNANIQKDYICFSLSELAESNEDIDLERIFPKDIYEH